MASATAYKRTDIWITLPSPRRARKIVSSRPLPSYRPISSTPGASFGCSSETDGGWPVRPPSSSANCLGACAVLSHLRDVALLDRGGLGGCVVGEDVGCNCRVDRGRDVQVDKRHLGAVRQLGDHLVVELLRSHF